MPMIVVAVLVLIAMTMGSSSRIDQLERTQAHMSNQIQDLTTRLTAANGALASKLTAATAAQSAAEQSEAQAKADLVAAQAQIPSPDDIAALSAAVTQTEQIAAPSQVVSADGSATGGSQS